MGAVVVEEEELFFAEEEEHQPVVTRQPWKVLLVDDDRSVHEVTLLTLSGFRYEGRGLEFLHAYSGEEAKAIMAQSTDVAMMLLDVVMEEDHAGLEVVRHVREVLKNPFVRIILRTGQPGQAPEEQVIVDYDINDYKEKTELTAHKLNTMMVTTLRAYQSTMQLEKSRLGLEKIVDASASVFKIKSMEEFVQGVLMQVVALAGLDDDAFCAMGSTLLSRYEAASGGYEVCRIMAGTGQYSGMSGRLITEVVDEATQQKLAQARNQRQSLFFEHECVIYFHGGEQYAGVLYLQGKEGFDTTERHLIELFGHNLSIATDNIELNSELQSTQEDVIHLLGTVSEFHSKETSRHVQRVGRYAARLAELHGLDPYEVELLEQAAPLHDMGKVGIPDSILNKPGRLSDAEMEEMRQHPQIGHEILSRNSNRPVLMAASTIALQHHEKWDGSGYPQGLQGEQIHIYGRLAAMADVFDALASPRCYKAAWTMEQVRGYFEGQKGGHFDPDLTTLLLEHFGDFVSIYEELPD
jgi:response regulator RpfG family c-di-GMP phosphodiesterase